MSLAPKRWRATIIYRSANGAVDVTHEIEEIDEVQDLVERGPDWNTIDHVRIDLLRPTSPGLTLENAEKL